MQFASFEEFWPYYLTQHADPMCRKLHITGTAIAIGLLAASPLFPPLAITAPVVGYSFSWIGHFFFERNKPAAWQNPLWSLRGDLRMLRLALLSEVR